MSDNGHFFRYTNNIQAQLTQAKSIAKPGYFIIPVIPFQANNCAY